MESVVGILYNLHRRRLVRGGANNRNIRQPLVTRLVKDTEAKVDNIKGIRKGAFFMLSSGINKEKLCLLMTLTRISRSFKDISLSFEPHPVSQDLKVLKNESAIRRSVRNIVQTIPTEKYFDPLFGSDVYSSLFDFVDFGTASNIQDQIKVALNNFEPRIVNVQVNVNAQPDTNEFEITIIYDIIGQEFPTQEYTFLLEATR